MSKPGNTERKHLPVFIELADGQLEVREGLPFGGRAECRNGPRPCGWIRCSANLYMESAEDRPGRRHGGRFPSSTLRPVWLDPVTGERLRRDQLPPSCMLDVIAEHGALPLDQVAKLLGLTSRRRMEQLTKRARDWLDEQRQLRAVELDDEPEHLPSPLGLAQIHGR